MQAKAYTPLRGYSTKVEPVRRPLGIVFGGGGWRAAAISWATARAMTTDPHAFAESTPLSLFEYATHIGSNSGGTWGAVPLVFSPSFYANLTGPSELEGVVNGWASRFRASMHAALNASELPESARVPTGCPELKLLVSIMDKLAPTPLSEYAAWEAGGAWAHGRFNTSWMEVMLRDLVPDPSAMSFAAARAAPFLDTTLVIGASASGSAYTESATVAEQHAISFVTVVYNASSVANATALAAKHAGYRGAIPLPFVSPATADAPRGFSLPPDVVSLAVATPNTSLGSICFEACFQNYSFYECTLCKLHQRTPLQLPADLPIAQLAQASGAGFAGFGTPEWIRSACDGFLPILPPSIRPKALTSAVVECAKDSLLPGLAQLIQSEPVPIRLVDGGFGDVGGAAYTLGAMQAGCARKLYDCTAGLGLVILNPDGGKWDGIDARLYFSDLLNGSVAPGEYVLDDFSKVPTLNPAVTIFAQNYTDLNFTTFSSTVYNVDANNTQGASYWMGQLSTITNDWYGVRGGHNVSALIVNFNTADALRSTYGDPSALESDFRKWHAPAAAVFARVLRPLLEYFIIGNGTIAPQ